MKCKVMFARFPGNFHEDPDTVNWIIKTHREMDHDPRIESVMAYVKSDTPIDMVRNECVQNAIDRGADYLLMIDNDMKPDWAIPGRPFVPFWKSAFDWMWRREAPTILFSPYCGPNPHNNIYVFRSDNYNNDIWNPENHCLRQFLRQEAAERSGIERVTAGPTGLMLIDMRIFSNPKLQIPWFDYEREEDGVKCPSCGQHKRGKWLKKGSTEDVYFTRNVTTAWHDTPGAGCYVNWDSWSVHIKRSYCYPPEVMDAAHLGRLFHAQDLRRKELGMRDGEVFEIKNVGSRSPTKVLDDKTLYVDLNNPENPDDPYGDAFRPDDPPNDGRIVMVDTAEYVDQIRKAYPELVEGGGDNAI